ncbi:MAG: DUF4830 domain-containing protein [Ruminiclostridium sp.]|nr:DUF4830 domain-containing protein [Ruminiclostridium sp.]
MRKITALIAGAAIIAAIILSFSACAKTYPAKTEEQIVDMLSGCGIETAGSCTKKTVTIPDEFGEVYERYNELQKRQGFDLSRYRSREAVVYTFPVASVDGVHTDFAEAHVMVCDDIVIGGDLADTGLSGGMLPLLSRSKDDRAQA